MHLHDIKKLKRILGISIHFQEKKMELAMQIQNNYMAIDNIGELKRMELAVSHTSFMMQVHKLKSKP
jgi:hypothetical protein